jgi:uncharacterized protein YecE (DUF72 family)
VISTLLYIGTSGWAYPEWRGIKGNPGKPSFYPAGVGPARYLEHYCSVFDACEINTTFYRIHDRTVAERWARDTPTAFHFTAKVHRRLTHARRAQHSKLGEFLAEFEASLEPLGPRLKALLWQFPPTFERDDEALVRLLRLPRTRVSCAFEFRHDSWNGPDVERALIDAGAARCVAEGDGRAPEALPAGPIAYVRLRGDRYAAPERARWLELLVAEGRTRDVYVFTKHRDAPADDPHTGLGLARWLRAASGIAR